MGYIFCKKVIFNWFYSLENGEDFCSYTVGENAKEILYCEEEHFCDVFTYKGEKIRIFNINTVEFDLNKGDL